MDVRKRLATNMRRMRKERNWSQEHLAHECGMDRTYISQLERMKKNATIESVQKLVDALDSSFSELLDPAS